MSHLLVLFIALDSRQCNKKRKRKGCFQIGKKEVKLFVFLEDMIPYLEDPKEPIK